MEYTIEYPHGLSGEDVVGVRITALVVRLDAVIKFARSELLPQIEREEFIYKRLGHDHDGVLRYYGSLDGALILQYACNGSIRQYFTAASKPIPLSLQLRWVEQITTFICFIHSKNVLHGDISCNNMFLDEELNTKLGDFAGSSIDGQAPCYETSHQHPKIVGISIRSEIFALGSTFYEIMVGSKPYEELSAPEVWDAYAQDRYPSLISLAAFGNMIAKCWAQGYTSMDELLEDVRTEVNTKSNIAAQIQTSTSCRATTFSISLAIISLIPVMFWARNRSR